jgi:mono/diheme cytochrome c family protein
MAWLESLVVLAALVVSDSSASASEPSPAAALFGRHCAVCHGSEGRGDGTAAARLRTPPANLTDGLVKFRSTPQEEPPLLADITRTIRAGSRGTGMVEWGSFLTSAEIELLAAYVFALEGFASRPPPAAEDPWPETLAAEAASPEDGATLYARFGCSQCHGAARRGDGPAAAGLRGSNQRSLLMPDLSMLPYKRGTDPVDAAKSILYGMDGTPMASFTGAITVREALSIARWLVDSASVSRVGFVGEEHLGFMIEMHEGGRHGMGMHRGMGRHGMQRGRRGEG